MHLNNYQNRHDLLIDWMLEELSPEARVLDVGANDGSFCPEVKRVADNVRLFAGVDPDESKLNRHPFLDQRYPALLEEAEIDANSFDCLYAIYVFEHVSDPHRFLEAAGRILKPGGSLFFITPNGYQYFAFLASLFGKLGAQRAVLKAIRPEQLVDRYHYPAYYRLNSPRRLRKLGREYGFTQCEFRYSERLDEFACYFPGVTKVFPKLWEKMVQVTGAEKLLGNLMGRMIQG
jgi:SAM-dependent methyltransferase